MHTLQAHEENKKLRRGPGHFVTIPKILMDIISKLLEPTANQEYKISLPKKKF